jgi:cell division inhibitor SepF
MSGALRKTMIYLGLAEDDDRYVAYEEYDEEFDSVVDEVEDDSPRSAAVTPIQRSQVAKVVPHPSARDMHRIATVHPRSYNEAKTIGEAFRGGTPVIMNLTDMEDADAKRLVDFSAGLVFGLHGSIERVTNRVFLLSPANVEVAPAEKPRTTERAFFNQS